MNKSTVNKQTTAAKLVAYLRTPLGINRLVTFTTDTAAHAADFAGKITDTEMNYEFSPALNYNSMTVLLTRGQKWVFDDEVAALARLATDAGFPDVYDIEG